MFFSHTIDNKPTVVDADGNTIVDLASRMFKRQSDPLINGTYKKVTSYFEMRADLISNAEYGSTDGTEFILKYSGISNPFSLCEGDIIMIPNYQEATNQMDDSGTILDTSNQTNEVLIKNYFKYQPAYTSGAKDASSYNTILNTSIPSGNVSISQTDPTIPYISDDGQTAITIRNGRMYFGENNGMTSAAMLNGVAVNSSTISNKIQQLVNDTATAFSGSNCLYNGTSLVTINRSQTK